MVHPIKDIAGRTVMITIPKSCRELNLVGTLTFNYTLISNISTAYNSGHILASFFLGQQFVYQKRIRIPLGKDCY